MTSFVRALSIAVSGLALFACGSAKTPDAVKNELAGGPANTTTIVAFTDYECPYLSLIHISEPTRPY